MRALSGHSEPRPLYREAPACSNDWRERFGACRPSQWNSTKGCCCRIVNTGSLNVRDVARCRQLDVVLGNLKDVGVTMRLPPAYDTYRVIRATGATAWCQAKRPPLNRNSLQRSGD